MLPSVFSADDDGNAVGDDGDFCVLAFDLEGALQCLVEGQCVLHVHVANHLRIAEIRDHDDGEAVEDACEDLHLPLVWQRVFLRRRFDLVEQCARRLGGLQGLVEGFAAVTVVAGCDHDDDAALVAVRLGCRHALDCLIDVLVERVAAVRRYDDVGRVALDFGECAHVVAARDVRFLAVAGKGGDDFLFRIDDDVQNEGELRFLRRVEHVAVDGVAVEDARARLVTLDELAAVVRHDRLGGSDAGQDRLAAAREACEEVRLDETFGDEQIGVDGCTVDEQLAAGRQEAEIRHRRVVLRIVDDDLFVLDDILAEAVDEFFMRRRTVEARRDED